MNVSIDHAPGMYIVKLLDKTWKHDYVMIGVHGLPYKEVKFGVPVQLTFGELVVLRITRWREGGVLNRLAPWQQSYKIERVGDGQS
jgi:hypothetical protein